MAIVGIDLGTYNSAVAYINKHGGIEVLPNAEGDQLTPSVVFFDGDEVIVGKIAKQNAIVEGEKVVTSIKRDMGKTDFDFEHNGKKYTPPEVSSFILRKLKDDAKARLGEEVEEAVITVPAHFDQAQRKMTEEAAALAGLKIKQIINEPTAAALAYGLDNIDANQKILVYDLGGGTFDVTIMEIKDQELMVINNEGDPELGGKDWDTRIIEYVVEQFKSEHNNEDPLADLQTHQTLQDQAEGAKEALSKRTSVKINCSYNGMNTVVELSRDKFEELTRDLLDRTEVLVKQAMDESNIKCEDIGTVLMVGGSCKMPMVEAKLMSICSGWEPKKAKSLDLMVVHGAALVTKAEAPPAPPESSEGDEQEPGPTGAEIVTDEGSIMFFDVLNKSVGVQTLDPQSNNLVITKMLEKNSKLGTAEKKIFYTARPGATTIDIKVFEGEDPDPNYCVYLGVAHIADLPAGRPAQQPVEVTLESTASGTIKVVGKDLNSGQDVNAEIKLAVARSEDELQQRKEELHEELAVS
ncbi:MAG: Hsp70 family protein [bacterium]